MHAGGGFTIVAILLQPLFLCQLSVISYISQWASQQSSRQKAWQPASNVVADYCLHIQIILSFIWQISKDILIALFSYVAFLKRKFSGNTYHHNLAAVFASQIKSVFDDD